jgi:hypothetical protein
MKTKLSIISILFFLFSINEAVAQHNISENGSENSYGNEYGNNGRMNQTGGMSGINQLQEKPKEIPAEITAGKIVANWKPELSLDALQEIAVANVLTESLKSQAAILKQSISQEDKAKEIQTLFDLANSKINQFLTTEQKEKFKNMQEDAKNPNKMKKKKKRAEPETN